jgi:hypothetical protein
VIKIKAIDDRMDETARALSMCIVVDKPVIGFR